MLPWCSHGTSVSARRRQSLLLGATVGGSIFFYIIYSSVVVSMTDFSRTTRWRPYFLHANASLTSEQEATEAPTVPLHNVTIVTAFLDIGEFGKGSPSNKRDWHIYMKWSTAYSRVLSPVVMYTNSDTFARHFESVRGKLPHLTKVIRLPLTSLWVFGLKPKIAAIYAGGYPKHYPNTVYPEYTCVTHAKFDVLRDVLEKNYFPSHHIAWMDVGYLRNIAGQKPPLNYTMFPPPEYDPRRVLCGEVFNPDFNRAWKGILRGNVNWVAGGFFLARRDVMSTFVDQYRRAVTLFLEQGESQVEQHILYAMYTKEGRAIVKPTVELQALHGDWFYIGFRCLKPLPHNTSQLEVTTQP
ncbi:uncharacterized protein LOC143285730 [Babylonia areolata]|uniref:uncharacterized protein LOC143285730 n=1 Tax=Babylonia areolata TaxID=304850 RepID=UPI003FD30E90